MLQMGAGKGSENSLAGASKMAAGVTDRPCLLNAIDGLNEHLDQNEVVLGKDVLCFPFQNPFRRLPVSE